MCHAIQTPILRLQTLICHAYRRRGRLIDLCAHGPFHCIKLTIPLIFSPLTLSHTRRTLDNLMSSQVPYSPLRRRDPSISGDEATPRTSRSRSASHNRRSARAAGSSGPSTSRRDEGQDVELRRLASRVSDASNEKTGSEDEEEETDSEADDLEALLRDPATDESKAHAALEEDLTSEDSIAVVRRTIPETDDPTLPALTLRAFLIGSVFACIGGGLSQVSTCASSSSWLCCAMAC